MKLNGKKLDARARTIIEIPRPDRVIEVEVETYPLDFDLDDYLPNPSPPIKPRRSKKSGEVLRDGGEVLLLPDVDDKTYLKHRNKIATLRTVAAVYFAVIGTGKMVFESVDGEPKKFDEAFFEKIAAELKDAGFTPGDITHISNKALEFSNMTPVLDVEAYQADFSPKKKSPSG